MAGDPRDLERRDAYRELFERSADAILFIEGDTFIDCNDAAVAMLHASSREAVLRLHPSEISPPRQPDGRDSFEKANELDRILAEIDGPVMIHCGSGNRVGALMSLRASINGADDETAVEAGKQTGLTRLEPTVRERLQER